MTILSAFNRECLYSSKKKPLNIQKYNRTFPIIPHQIEFYRYCYELSLNCYTKNHNHSVASPTTQLYQVRQQNENRKNKCYIVQLYFKMQLSHTQFMQQTHIVLLAIADKKLSRTMRKYNGLQILTIINIQNTTYIRICICVYICTSTHQLYYRPSSQKRIMVILEYYLACMYRERESVCTSCTSATCV